MKPDNPRAKWWLGNHYKCMQCKPIPLGSDAYPVPPPILADVASWYADALEYVFTGYTNAENDAAAMRTRLVCVLLKTAELIKRLEVFHPKLDGESFKCIELAAMMHDLDRGVVHPVLRPSVIHSRSPDRTDVWAVRVGAVLGFEGLIRAGDSARGAAQTIAKRFKKFSRAMRNQPGDLAGSLKSWRTSLKDGTAKNVVALANYEGGMQILEIVARNCPSQLLRDFSMSRLSISERDAAKLVLIKPTEAI